MSGEAGISTIVCMHLADVDRDYCHHPIAALRPGAHTQRAEVLVVVSEQKARREQGGRREVTGVFGSLNFDRREPIRTVRLWGIVSLGRPSTGTFRALASGLKPAGEAGGPLSSI
jgi:hypothetical protein